jgi:hypothetical protein
LITRIIFGDEYRSYSVPNTDLKFWWSFRNRTELRLQDRALSKGWYLCCRIFGLTGLQQLLVSSKLN